MNNSPAFPVTSEQWAQGFSGLSIRDYFAAAALQGQCAVPDDRQCPKERLQEVWKWRAEMYAVDARLAYMWADAMLAQREKKTP